MSGVWIISMPPPEETPEVFPSLEAKESALLERIRGALAIVGLDCTPSGNAIAVAHLTVSLHRVRDRKRDCPSGKLHVRVHPVKNPAQGYLNFGPGYAGETFTLREHGGGWTGRDIDDIQRVVQQEIARSVESEIARQTYRRREILIKARAWSPRLDAALRLSPRGLNVNLDELAPYLQLIDWEARPCRR